MSKDIRSFFKTISTKSSTATSSKPTNKRVICLDSSDDDFISETPEKQKQKKRKTQVISSDSEDEKLKNKSSHPVKLDNRQEKKPLKHVSVLDAFGSEPIKQTKVEKPKAVEIKEQPIKNKTKSKKKLKTEVGIHHDKDFETSLLELDEDILLECIDDIDKTIENLDKKDNSQYRHNDKEISSSSKSEHKHLNLNSSVTKKKLHSPDAKEQRKKANGPPEDGKNSSVTIKKVQTPDAKEKHQKTSSSSEDAKTPGRKRKRSETNDIDPDQERYEKRIHSAMLYQKYLQRGGPAHHGAKELPKGKPDCLKNLCFLRTGVLDSLESEEFENLVKDHGGRIVHGVSKKVNYVVVGDEPGPAKLQKAADYGIKTISEDELLDLIRTKSGMELKFVEEKQPTVEEHLQQSEKMTDEVKSKDDGFEASTGKHKKNSDSKPNLKKVGDNASVKIKNNADKCDDIPKQTIKSKDEVEATVSKSFYKKEPPPKPTKPTFVKTERIRDENKSAEHNMPWTEKYKPDNIKAIIGQQTESSNMKKLMVWLENWYKNHTGKNPPTLHRPSPWAKNDNGAFFKAVLLSGPPGVGKTTTATLVAKELGFDIVEFNASDTRSKKLLNEEVGQLLSTTSLALYFKADNETPKNKRVLLMDEVDGMAGNEDRGGMQELIQLIKNSCVPIICMCNDRNHQKIRSLANYCFDLRFSRPRMEQIRGAMMSICFKENIKITPQALTEVITGTGMDIRLTLNHLSLWCATDKSLSADLAKKEATLSTKDVPLGPWEVCRKVFSEEDHKTMSVGDRARLFFYDYSIGPLFVQENYLKVVPHAPKKDFLKRMSDAADAISMGDVIDTKIRRTNNWSLLESEAMYSSVLPGYYMRGHVGGQINFPSWLGKNSKRSRLMRLQREVHNHMGLRISGNKQAVKMDYINHLRNNIIKPLVKEGTNGVEKSIEILHSYDLLKEDFDSLLELAQWRKQKDPMSMVDSKVKAAFTRAYNKQNFKLPYAIPSVPLKKRIKLNLDDELHGDEAAENSNSEEDEDDVGVDAMIKAKKNSKTSAKQSGASSSKAKGGKGKKRSEASTSKEKKGKGTSKRNQQKK